MVRFASLAAALVTSVLLLSGTAGHAQAAGYYTATPVVQPTKTSFMTRETIWRLQDGAFVARKGDERAAIACSLVAQRAGKLASFAVDGAAVPADALDKCNAKAK